MEETKPTKAIHTILSVIAGLVSAAATFVLLILIFFATGLFGWSDGGEKAYLERLEKNTHITFILSILIAVGIGVYVVIKMNRNNNEN